MHTYRAIPQRQIQRLGLQSGAVQCWRAAHRKARTDRPEAVLDALGRPHVAGHVQQPRLLLAGDDKALLQSSHIGRVMLLHQAANCGDGLLGCGGTLQRQSANGIRVSSTTHEKLVSISHQPGQIGGSELAVCFVTPRNRHGDAFLVGTAVRAPNAGRSVQDDGMRRAGAGQLDRGALQR